MAIYTTALSSSDGGTISLPSDLTASNGMSIPDDITLKFGTGADATIEYDEDGTDELRFAGAAVTFEQAVTFDGNITLGDAAADTITVSGDLTASNGLLIPDDVNLTFGTGADVTIEYDEDGTDQLRLAGNSIILGQALTASDGLVVSGSTFMSGALYVSEVQSAPGTPEDDKIVIYGLTGSLFAKDATGHDFKFGAGAGGVGASDNTTFTGNNTFSGKLTASNGLLIPDDVFFTLGTGADFTIEYDEDGTDVARFAGAHATFDTAITAAQGIAVTGEQGVTSTIISGSGNASIGGTLSVDGNVDFDKNLVVSGTLVLGSVAAAGADVDQFLVLGTDGTGLNNVQLRAGSDVATDIGAVSTSANSTFTGNNTFSGKLTASNGLLIPDDVNLTFGTGADATIEYDEDGTDQLRILGPAAGTVVTSDLTASNGMLVADDMKLLFGTGADFSIEYDEDGTDVARFAGAHATFDTAITAAQGIAVTGEQGVTSTIISGSGNASIGGTLSVDGDADFDKRLIVSGNLVLGSVAAAGTDVDQFLVLGTDGTGLNVVQKRAGADVATDIGAVSTSANSTFTGNNTFSGKLTASNGLLIPDDVFLTFGTGADATIEYDEDGTDELRFAGAAVTFEQAVTFDGNVTLGDAQTDTVTLNGTTTIAGDLTASNGISTTIISGSGNASIGGTLSVDGIADFDKNLTVSGTLVLGSVAAAGADVDQFLVLGTDGTGLNNVQKRTGAQVATDIGAVAASANSTFTGNNTFSGKLTASNGLATTIIEGTSNALQLGLAGDAITVLAKVTASNDILIGDDINLVFGTGADATIEYDEDGTDELRFAGAAVTFEQAVTFDGNMTLGNAAADTVEVQGVLTASADVIVADDKKIYFGTDKDASIEYDEDGTDQLRIAGDVIVDAKLTASNGMLIPDDVFLTFGTGADATIEYDEDGTDQLRIVGPAAGTVVTSDLTASNGMLVADDMKLLFGAGADFSIEYDEDGTDVARFAGAHATFDTAITAAQGIAVTGDTGVTSTIISGSGNASIGGTLSVDGIADFDKNVTVSGTLVLGSVAAAGADVDQFLVLGTDGTGLNNVQLRAGADVATDIGAVSTSANSTFTGNNTFSGKLTASNGLLIPDDVFLTFGTGADATIEYDEDGTDQLRFTGPNAGVIFATDVSCSQGITVTGIISGSGNASVGGSLEVDGDTNLDHDLTVSGTLKATGLSLSSNDAGTSNTLFGLNAGAAVASGCNYNVVVGEEAANDLSSGDNNVFIGYQAGDKTTDVDKTVVIGAGACGAIMTAGADATVAIGYAAGAAITSGQGNVAIGDRALTAEDDGDFNTAIGAGALLVQTGVSGETSNTAVGYIAASRLTTGIKNVFMGAGVAANTVTVDNAVIIGYGAGAGVLSADADGTVAIGYQAGASLTDGVGNIAIGDAALDTETVGDQNVAIGTQALTAQNGTDGEVGNTAVGFGAGKFVTTATGCTFIGNECGQGHGPAKLTGNNNTGLGSDAGLLLQGAAHSNTYIGATAGNVTTTGVENTCLGFNADIQDATATNQVVIGNNIAGTKDNAVFIGNDSSHIENDFNADATWNHSSDVRQKTNIQDDILGLDFINNLRTVTYTHKSPSEFPEEWVAYNPDDKEPMGGGNVIHGFIAQEVKEALEQAGCETFGGWNVDPDGRQRVSFEAFVMPLVRSVQELSAEVKALKEKLKE